MKTLWGVKLGSRRKKSRIYKRNASVGTPRLEPVAARK